MDTTERRSASAGFTALVVALAVATVGIGGYVVSAASPRPMVILLVIVGAVVLEASPVGINKDLIATMSVIAVFVAIAVGGLPGAFAAGVSVGLTTFLAIERQRVLKTVANVGMHVVSAALAAVAFASVAGVDLVAPAPGDAMSEPSRMVLAMLVAGVVYTVVNGAIVSVGVHLASGVPIVQTAVGISGQLALMQFLSVGLSAIAYFLLIEVGVASLILIMVPLFLARRALLSVQQRQEAFDRMVRTFVKAIELKDGYTRGHAERVSDLSVLVAERMGLSYEERQLIRYGAILHDVGKIGVSLGILCKAGPLTDDEYDEMKLHPEIGSEMLADIDFLQPALAIVHHHHERIDGRGYPAGLTGDAIPLLTRVVTAVDAFDAMTSTRSYRRALPVPVAISELQANAGSQFDREVVDHLVAVIAERGWTVTDEPVEVAEKLLGKGRS